MKITQVEYRELRSGDNFSNETVGAVAQVEDGENPDAALRGLREWVQEQLVGSIERDRQYTVLSSQVGELEWRKRDIERSIAVAQDKWDRAKAFLEKHGIAADYDDLPF